MLGFAPIGVNPIGYVAAGGAVRALSASLSVSSIASVSMALSKPMSANLASTATIVPVLGLGKSLQASLLSVAAVSPGLVLTVPLASTLRAVAGLQPAVSLAVPLTAPLTAQASSWATLSVVARPSVALASSLVANSGLFVWADGFVSAVSLDGNRIVLSNTGSNKVFPTDPGSRVVSIASSQLADRTVKVS